MAFTLGLQDIRFLLSRVRGEWLPEELGGLAAQGPTGVRDVQGVGNQGNDPLQPNYWWGAADTLFIRTTFNRLTNPTKKNDVISAPFANSDRGSNKTVVIGDTVNLSPTGTVSVTGGIADALNPRNISNLIVDSSDPIGFSSISVTDTNYANKVQLKLQDDPTGRVSPVSGAVNPLPYSNWTSQFGQFFDHGLDFVSKGVDGKVQVDLLPSDGLYIAGRATSITGSRNNTANVTIGAGSTDDLLRKMGISTGQQDQPTWTISATITKPNVVGGVNFRYEGTLVLNNTLITIGASDEIDLAAQINMYTPTTGVVATVTPFPAIDDVSQQGSFQLTLAPARAESFNLTSPFIDLSQNYGSDKNRAFFVREYLSETEWRTAIVNLSAEATITDLTTGRLVNAGKSVNGELDAGMANWLQIKQNAAKVGIILHDADITAVPMVAFDAFGDLVLGSDGLPRLVALNKVTGEIVYVQNTNLGQDAAIQAKIDDPYTNWQASDFVLMTSKHAFLNDMGVRLPALTDTTIWDGRDLKDVVIPASQYGPAVNYKQALEAHYVSGDGRLNENIGLTAVHEAFLTEHNRMVTQLKANYGFTGDQPQGGWTWSDPLTGVTTRVTGEELFQQAKFILEMHYQHLVFDQFVRKISPNILAFAGVNPLVNASITSEFANAVYRFGHSMLPEAVGMRQYADATSISTTSGSDVVTVTMGAGHGLKVGSTITLSSVDSPIGGIAATALNGTFVVKTVNDNLITFQAATAANVDPTGTARGLAADKVQIDINRGLIDAFLNPQSYTPGETSKLLVDGSTAQVAMRIDEKVTDALRDNLLGQPLDLATLNLVRGRDAGLPTLNEMRASIQAVAPLALQATLTPYTSWTNFRDNLKGALADQDATAKNFIMAYASDAVLTAYAAGKSLGDWYALRDGTADVVLAIYANTKTLTEWNNLKNSQNQPDKDAYALALKNAQIAAGQDYMAGLIAATNAAFADPTFMGTSGNKDFNRIDAWIGGLAEREVIGGMLGSTFDAIFAMQMMDLQNGDFFYYLGRVPNAEFFIENMEGRMLADLVMQGTGATDVYADIFSVADKYIQVGDTAAHGSAFASLAALQASTTVTNAMNANGNLVPASLGRAGFVTIGANNVFHGNPGNYVDARGVLNPNGVGNASEMISGTAGVDRINGLGGNDTIRGGAGNDILDGGAGVDFLYGDDGDDTMDGGVDNDFMYGEAGNDTMRGGIGIDTMFGADGNDNIFGGLDGDIINGGAGDDLIYGGDNVTIGGVLDPEVAVAVALLDDSLNGGAGNDTLYGGGGWDILLGMSGHDILVPGTGGNAQGGRDTMDGGEGDDIYIVEDALSFQSQDFSDTGLTEDQLILKGTGFRDLKPTTNFLPGQGNGLGIDEVRITQTVAGDFIIGGTNGLGVAQLFTGIERIVIGTGNANNAIRTGTAAINIDASLAVPNINKGLQILGNSGANIIIGTAFNDYLDGGAGNDTLEGHIGDDTYVIDSLGDILVEATGSGNDTVIIQGSFNYTLGTDFENLVLQGTALQGTGNELDNVITGNASNNVLRGLAGNDTLVGGAGADQLWGGAGFDILTGDAGRDVFVFTSLADIGNSDLLVETVTDFEVGVDLLNLTSIDADTGTAGTQQFSFINGAAFTAGVAGRLRYEGGVLYGDVNGDQVADFRIKMLGQPALTAASFATPPTMSIAAPAGAGINEGNGGTSQHVFTVRLSQATIVDVTFNWAVTGTGTAPADRVDFGGTLPSGTVTIAAGATTATITVNVTGDTTSESTEAFLVTLSNPLGAVFANGTVTATATSTIINDDVINGTNGNNTLNGTAAGDTINGRGGNDILNGNAGNDTLNGGTGNDQLNGGDGNDILDGGGSTNNGVDTLNGGAGDDVLIGSTGLDSMTGGTGADIFRFSASIAQIGTAAANRDVITDFSSAQGDRIDLSAIDANTGQGGDQAFTFIGDAAFSAAGQLRYANGVLEGNVGGTLAADFSITLQNGPALQAADFFL